MPNLLVSRDPKIKTIKDFTDKDRISMAGAGSSVQTVYLQMAVSKVWGIKSYKKLDHLMVNLPHPAGLQALPSGSGAITSMFTSSEERRVGKGGVRPCRSRWSRYH